MDTQDILSIIGQTDLLSLVESAGAVLHDKGRGRWRSCCPLHNGRDPSAFSIIEGSDGRFRWTCYSGDCGSGDAIDFVMKWQGLNFVEACQHLGGDLQLDSELVRKMAEERRKKAELEYRAAKARLEKAIADLENAKVWERYHANIQASPALRSLWRFRGVPDAWQDIWRLGYAEDFNVWEPDDEGGWKVAWSSPSLAIPVFQPGWKIATIRHRLLQPKEPGDRYRPDRSSLPSFPFLGNPEAGRKGPVLVVEGEIKAMVSFLTVDDPKLQVIGIPGKRQFMNFLSILAEAEPIYILPDPDGEDFGLRLAQALGLQRCRLIRLPVKVDDAIVNGVLDRDSLRRLMRFAPKIRGVPNVA